MSSSSEERWASWAEDAGPPEDSWWAAAVTWAALLGLLWAAPPRVLWALLAVFGVFDVIRERRRR